MDALGADPLRFRVDERVVRHTVSVLLSLFVAVTPIAFAQAGPQVGDGGADPAATLARLLDVPFGQACAETGAAVEIDGVGRAVYDRVAFDGAAGTATLQGGVCVELVGIEARLRAGRIDLAGLNDDRPATLRADGVLLDVDGWRLGVGAMEGNVDAPVLNDVVLLGRGVVGRARRGGVLDDGLFLAEVAVATSSYRIDARLATLVGPDLVLREASGTSCTCRVERYRLSATEIATPIDGGITRVTGARVQVFGLDVPLVDTFVLRGDGSDVAFPIAVQARDELGTVVAWSARDAGGASLELGTTVGAGSWPLLTLRVRPDGDVATLAFDRRGLTIEASRERPIGAGATVEAVSSVDLRADEPLLRNGVVLRSAEWSGTEVREGTTVRATASATAAADVAAEPARDVASLRTPVRLDTAVHVPLGSVAELELALRGDAIWYPGLPGGSVVQAAGTGTARLRVRSAGLDAQLFAVRRATTGASPFLFDATDERARVGAVGSWSAGPLDGRLRAEWRLAPEMAGAEELEARLRVTPVDAGPWRVVVAAEADVAGRFDGPSDEDWIEASAAVEHGGGASLRIAHRWDAAALASRSWSVAAAYRPGGEARIGATFERSTPEAAWTTVEASGAWPIDVAAGEVDVRLVPRAAVEFAPWIEGDALRPSWSEHGLTVYLDDCCGTLRLGYLHDAEDGLSIDVGVVLPPLTIEPLSPVDLPDLPALPPAYGGAP